MSTLVTVLIYGPIVLVFLGVIVATIWIRKRAVRAHFGKDINQAAQEKWDVDRQKAQQISAEPERR